MNVKEGIQEIFGQLPPSSHLSQAFEPIVLRLLQEHLHKANKVLQTGFETNEHMYHQAYAVAPDGIDNLLGPTLIDIKFFGQKRLRLEVIDKIVQLSNLIECRSAMLILGGHLRDEHRQRILSFWSTCALGIPLVLWDMEKIDELYSKYQNKIAPLLTNLAEFRLRSVVERPSTDWKKEREKRMNNLAECLNQGSISLVLGAGVSIDSGLPDLTRLLDSLFVRLLTKGLTAKSDIRNEEIEGIVKRLNDVDDHSALMTTRYLRSGLNDSVSNEGVESFCTTLGAELYRRSKRRTKTDTWIQALAEMTLPRRTGTKIKAVVTYNFDDLLEKELINRGGMFRSVFREGDIPTSDELPIYHVHGFIPEDPESYDHLDESHLVFSEEGYHEIYVDSYHWSNLVQLNLFRESTCLFVGMPLTDPNLRRLLEISARRTSDQKHFALMPRMNHELFTSDGGKTIVNARKQPVQQFL